MKRSLLILYLLLSMTQLEAAQDHLVAIQYHHFSDETPPSTSVTKKQFRQHIEFLKAGNYPIVDFEKSLKDIQAGRSLPDKAVAITIDDAYASVYDQAFPIFRQLQWPFIIFVATESIDQGHRAFVSWDQLREMVKHGASVGLHSHTHPYLVREKSEQSYQKWKKWVKEEITVSQQRIRQALGIEARLFAYPYGEYDPDIEEIIDELGLIGVGQHSGVIWSGSDFQALPRFPVSGSYAEMGAFAIKLNALPLPIIAIEPENPVVSRSDRRPELRLTVSPGPYEPSRFRCYASGQGQIDSRWIDHTVVVSPKQDLPLGRSKYNCTVPKTGTSRYYWYSRQWLRLQ